MAAVPLTPPDPGTAPRPLDWIDLTTEELPTEAATRWATTARSGGVVCFLGVVRDHADGIEGVERLTYEAYEEAARARLREIAAETRRQWPAVERLVLLHRLGDVALSEASVLVVASTPHRAEAFDAARYAIDTLKETVPIWKQEHWDGGSAWSPAAAPVRPVRQPGLV